MIFGAEPGYLLAFQERAKNAVMTVFVSRAEQDQVPPTLRALYVMKVQQAEAVLAGLPSAFIEREAAVRGYTPFQLATVILFMADQSVDLEVARSEINVEIENTTSEAEVLAVLDRLKIAMPPIPRKFVRTEEDLPG